jgi:hypothetical protein
MSPPTPHVSPNFTQGSPKPTQEWLRGCGFPKADSQWPRAAFLSFFKDPLNIPPPNTGYLCIIPYFVRYLKREIGHCPALSVAPQGLCNTEIV